MKRFWMTWPSQARQQPLRRPSLRPVRIKSLKSLKSINLTTFYPEPWRTRIAPHRMQVAGGMALAGLVLTQVPIAPTSLWRTPAEPVAVQSSLWEATGLVRQSVVDLYRARRIFMQAAPPSAQVPSTQAPGRSVAEGSPMANAASTVAPASAPPTASSSASAAPRANQSVPQPPAPPRPATNAAFDPAKTIDTNLEMRVAVAKGVSSLAVATSNDGYLMDLNGQGFCNLPAQQSMVLRPQGGGLGYGGCQLTNTVWLEPGEGGYVYVGDKWFKGRVLLMGNGSTLTAVNFVLMHDYLSSVVGSEMYVNWPLEALKAQAVAARSYALVHHVRNANRPYDLDNTQRYQAYLGIAKETNTTQAAVAATTGEFISYNGGIVESLYAASDAIVQAAHDGKGMSQTGAMELAKQGYGYTEILGNYYPNTSLSRLVVQ
jgi:stage II sporulation protein D